jgi:cation diffusion facilitator CzcD-associated flavoprotein CzcO
MSEHVRIAIIGAGFSGLGAAIRLRQRGIEDFVILERDEDVGGVWRDNRYPGCGCDVESPLYSFSFAPNPSWSRMYSPQAEILDYLRDCSARYELGPHLRFGCALEDASWDEQQHRWQLRTSQGQLSADLLIAGMGALSEPSIPDLRGRDSFEGRSFHSACWEDDAPLDGARVAVVGTGASAIQIVPNIQARVGHLKLFQRTAPWVIPRRDRAFSEAEKRLFARVPLAQKALRVGLYLRHEAFLVAFRNPALMRVAERVALRYLERTIHDPTLRSKLRPHFTFGCKRVLLSDDYYPALNQPNVELVAAGVRELIPEGIVDSEGCVHELDTIIFATGFLVTDPSFARYVRGRGGESLAEVWRGSPQAHMGTMVTGFPNLFLMTGPNTGLGHNSMVLMIEAQIELLLGALEELDRGAVTVEPTPEAQARFIAEIEQGGEGTVWTAGGCSSWYLDKTGRNSTLWPWSTYSFMRRAIFEREDYRVEEA